MKEINIVLTQTNTMVSKFLKFFSKKPYNHVSISLLEDCSTMYSFGRWVIWCPLIAGFVEEDPIEGVFKLHPETKCKIYKLELTDSDYNTMMKRLSKFIKNPNKFKYSFLNVFLMYFNVAYDRDYRYVCSSFVTYLLWGIIPVNKSISLVTPDDYNLMDFETIYEGKLKDYVNDKVVCCCNNN